MQDKMSGANHPHHLRAITSSATTNNDTAPGETSWALAIRDNPKQTLDFSAPDQLITFYIGNDNSRYYVHKEFVVRYSRFLRDVLSKPVATNDGALLRARTTYRLPDTNNGAFRLLSGWFYTQTLDLKEKHEEPLVSEELNDEVVEHLNECGDQDMDLCQLWVLAGLLEIPALQNQVVSVIYSMHEKCYLGVVSPHCYEWVYKHTNSRSPLRKLILDMCAWADRRWTIAKILSAFPHEMLVEMIALYQLAILPGTREALQADRDISDYFVSEDYV